MDPVLLSYHAPIHDLDVVGRYVVKEDLSQRLCAWKAATEAQELVYLATCQRVLWWVWGGNDAGLALGPDAQRYIGREAWVHLLGLAAGLESAHIGDREIPDQLRLALKEALEAGVAGEEATALFEDLVREGQRLRVSLGLADGQASVATVALRHLEQALTPGDRVALVGMGPMTTYLAERLAASGLDITLANRTASKAQAFAMGRGMKVVPLDALQRDPAGFQALVTATSSSEPLFTWEAWKDLPNRTTLRILDLALPADSEPALERLPWVHRIDLHAFLSETRSARDQRREAAMEAAPWLHQAALRLQERATARAEKRALGEIREQLNEGWDALEEACHEGSLAHLDPQQQEAVRDLLRRGRTLAHRALVQGQRAEAVSPTASGPVFPWGVQP